MRRILLIPLLAAGALAAPASAVAAPPTAATLAQVNAALTAFDRCGTSACRTAAIRRVATAAGTGFDAINSNRTVAEAPCEAAWSTRVQWGLIALRDSGKLLQESGSLNTNVLRLWRAGRKRITLAANERAACRVGTLPIPGGRFAACLRDAPGASCILTYYATVTPADVATDKPQLVTRLTCAGRPFRAHWELQVEGRPVSRSNGFLACLDKPRADFAVALDLEYMGFPLDARLPSRVFSAKLQIVDDDLRRVEGEAVYKVIFAAPANGDVTTGVPGAWTIESVAR